MLALFDPLDSLIHPFAGGERREFPLMHYASELMELLEMDLGQLAESVERALRACRALGIPEQEHFELIFNYTCDGMRKDFKLSSLGTYLVIINADPGNEAVARAQLYFLRMGP